MNDDAEVIRVIKTTLTTRGLGEAPDDPVREITQYWDMDGTLLWEDDPLDDMDVCCEVEPTDDELERAREMIQNCWDE